MALSDRRILVTGGAGFVGAAVATGVKERHPEATVVALDNLSRHGSELSLPRLRDAGVEFVQGDVRTKDDLFALGHIDALVECSAEPSVVAGVDDSPDQLIRTNLMGAYHCLELARRDNAQVVFLSTSRVFPVRHLLGIRLEQTETRFEIAESQELPGVSPAGISEDFPIWGARTMYGATKLSAEHLIEDYVEGYGLRGVVNRFGVIAGPFGHGVFTDWMQAHVAGEPLSYTAFGGKQVRDLLHVDDVVDLIAEQLGSPDWWTGLIANVGGGRAISLSLREATALCAEISGNPIDITNTHEGRDGDIPVYLSDCTRIFEHTDWRPRRDTRRILEDVYDWLAATRRRAPG